MAYEFKKLSEVELLESVPDGATVLAEVDGVIRRVPGSGLAGSGGSGSGGGVSSWNDLTDKPFYAEETLVEWLAETSLEFNPEGDSAPYMALVTPTEEMLAAWNDASLDTVEVTWDDKVYRCEKQNYMGAMYVAGNLDVMLGTGDNGIPFLIIVQGSDGVVYSITEMGDEDASDDPAITHNVGVKFVTTYVKKLDNTFLDIVDYSPEETKVIISEETIEGFAEDSSMGNGIYSVTKEGAYTALVTREKYTVVWDGDAYECVAFDFGSVAGVGNKMLAGGVDTGEPFGLGVSNGALVIYTTETDASHTVYVYQTIEEYCAVKDEVLVGKKVLPAITTEDNGKVLRVVGGKAVWWAVDQLDRPVYATLNDYSWEEIAGISADGLGDTFFDVGDCKAVAMSGTVGTLALDGTYYAYILGFDHNGATNSIDFGGFKTEDGLDLCLTDDRYNEWLSDGALYFNLNHWGGYNYGGWKGCDLRYDVLGSTDVEPSGYGAQVTTERVGYDASENCATTPVANTLMAALPSELRTHMKPMTIYTDNVGAATNTAECVTTSVDYLPLLSEFEIWGMQWGANAAEQNYQAQYEYYANGNSKIKNRHNAQDTAALWWERSPYYTNSDSFCGVYSGGAVAASGAGSSLGLAPAFRI